MEEKRTLRKAISELFPEDEVQIIDYVNVKHYIINAGGWFRFYKNRETLKEWFAKVQLPNTFAKARNQEMVLSKRCFNARQINELEFDCIVVGSDEVWNYRDTKGNAELKFGVGLTCKNLIAYAPSVGKTAADEAIPQYVIDGIRKFKRISARDDLTEQLVEQVTGNAPKRVLDPTFLAEFPRAELKAKRKPYILFYYCENLPENILNQIFSYAKEHILHFRPGVDTLSTYVEKIRQLRTFTKYERSIPRTRSVKTAKEIIDLKLDLIVLGSDEIWNLCGSGYHPLKFGTGLENQRTIAYAPSVGAVTEETAVPEDVFSGLKHLDRISGRDVESLKFVERACGRKAEKMLDPTFLYNFDMDIERENIKPKPYRYILIYDCKLTEPMAKQLQEYAKKNDLKIIGAGDYKTFYDEGFIDLTPYEWVDLFRNAEKVITGTFHGTVFSIKYNKSVLCYPTEKNRINKIRSLLSDMKIASRLLEVGCEDDFIPLLDTPMDYTETRNYIAQKIQEADDFLTGDKS